MPAANGSASSNTALPPMIPPIRALPADPTPRPVSLLAPPPVAVRPITRHRQRVRFPGAARVAGSLAFIVGAVGIAHLLIYALAGTGLQAPPSAAMNAAATGPSPSPMLPSDVLPMPSSDTVPVLPTETLPAALPASVPVVGGTVEASVPARIERYFATHPAAWWTASAMIEAALPVHYCELLDLTGDGRLNAVIGADCPVLTRTGHAWQPTVILLSFDATPGQPHAPVPGQSMGSLAVTVLAVDSVLDVAAQIAVEAPEHSAAAVVRLFRAGGICTQQLAVADVTGDGCADVVAIVTVGVGEVRAGLVVVWSAPTYRPTVVHLPTLPGSLESLELEPTIGAQHGRQWRIIRRTMADAVGDPTSPPGPVVTEVFALGGPTADPQRIGATVDDPHTIGQWLAAGEMCGRLGLGERADELLQRACALDPLAFSHLRGHSRVSRPEFLATLEALRDFAHR